MGTHFHRLLWRKIHGGTKMGIQTKNVETMSTLGAVIFVAFIAVIVVFVASTQNDEHEPDQF